MKSSTGEYYIGLDHVRALAVLLVWCWHFIHAHESNLEAAPVFPLNLLAEGHTGVAIFMVLSGYLFAKLLAGKRIDYAAFITNRFFRLVPLLFFVVSVVGVKLISQGDSPLGFLTMIAEGLVFPSLPNGGWSITVEFHFYLLLPLLLFLQGRWKFALIGVLLAAILLRALLHHEIGHIQKLSYFTLVGRIDQFLFGILAYQFRAHVQGRHLVAAITLTAFAMFYWYFDQLGGYAKAPSFPSPSALWIYIPAIEGFTYALLIAWYDTSFRHANGRVSRFVASIGTYSYSIYLLHFFVVYELSMRIDQYICDLSNIYVALFVALLTFPIMYPIGSVSYRVIELPFLAYRRKYILADGAGKGARREKRQRIPEPAA